MVSGSCALRQDSRHSAVALLLKAALIQVSDYRLLGASGFHWYYTPTHREGAILQSPCLSVCSHFCNRYLSFYWKKWFYIWYMALAWWLVPFLPFPGLPHIYFLFTVRLTNERVGVFLARRSVQHLVSLLGGFLSGGFCPVPNINKYM